MTTVEYLECLSKCLCNVPNSFQVYRLPTKRKWTILFCTVHDKYTTGCTTGHDEAAVHVPIGRVWVTVNWREVRSAQTQMHRPWWLEFRRHFCFGYTWTGSRNERYETLAPPTFAGQPNALMPIHVHPNRRTVGSAFEIIDEYDELLYEFGTARGRPTIRRFTLFPFLTGPGFVFWGVRRALVLYAYAALAVYTLLGGT